jgi:hypothetical protein
MHGEVEPRRHLTLCDFFPTFLQLLHLLLGAVPIPHREVDLCTALLHIPGDDPRDRGNLTIPGPRRFVGVAVIARLKTALTSGEVGISLDRSMAVVTGTNWMAASTAITTSLTEQSTFHPALLFLGDDIDPTIGNSSTAGSSGIPGSASGITQSMVPCAPVTTPYLQAVFTQRASIIGINR